MIIFIGFANQFILLHIYKKEKLSTLLPYDSLDKIFIVVIGFLFFQGTPQGAPLGTFLITLGTIALIIFFSVDIKNISFPKNIGLFFFYKFIKALTIVGTGYVLLLYSSTDYVILEALVGVCIAGGLVLMKQEQPKEMFLQTKTFYINRTLATALGRIGYIIGLYIIQSAGVVVATLLGFFYIAFSVFSMKFIVKDSPEKKQMLLALMVVVLVGIGYLFK